MLAITIDCEKYICETIKDCLTYLSVHKENTNDNFFSHGTLKPAQKHLTVLIQLALEKWFILQ